MRGFNKQKVVSLMTNEFIRYFDQRTGKIRVERGEKCVTPNPNEIVYESEGKRKAYDLKANEYVKIENIKTGEIRIAKGEQLVFLEAFEEVIDSKKTAIDLKSYEYVKMVNKQIR